MNIPRSLAIYFCDQKKKKGDLAKFADVSNVQVSKWCNGKAGMTLSALEKVSAFFGVKVSEFIAAGEDK